MEVRMGVPHNTVDKSLVDTIVNNLKSQGIFDNFRRDCLSDVDTKPAYQNLQQRLDGYVTSFLTTQEWRPDMNKNQLRETLRRKIMDWGMLSSGVDRIVDQVVNPKVDRLIFPRVETAVYENLIRQKVQEAVAAASSKHETSPGDSFSTILAPSLLQQKQPIATLSGITKLPQTPRTQAVSSSKESPGKTAPKPPAKPAVVRPKPQEPGTPTKTPDIRSVGTPEQSIKTPDAMVQTEPEIKKEIKPPVEEIKIEKPFYKGLRRIDDDSMSDSGDSIDISSNIEMGRSDNEEEIEVKSEDKLKIVTDEELSNQSVFMKDQKPDLKSKKDKDEKGSIKSSLSSKDKEKSFHSKTKQEADKHKSGSSSKTSSTSSSSKSSSSKHTSHSKSSTSTSHKDSKPKLSSSEADKKKSSTSFSSHNSRSSSHPHKDKYGSESSSKKFPHSAERHDSKKSGYSEDKGHQSPAKSSKLDFKTKDRKVDDSSKTKSKDDKTKSSSSRKEESSSSSSNSKIREEVKKSSSKSDHKSLKETDRKHESKEKSSSHNVEKKIIHKEKSSISSESSSNQSRIKSEKHIFDEQREGKGSRKEDEKSQKKRQIEREDEKLSRKRPTESEEGKSTKKGLTEKEKEKPSRKRPVESEEDETSSSSVQSAPAKHGKQDISQSKVTSSSSESSDQSSSGSRLEDDDSSNSSQSHGMSHRASKTTKLKAIPEENSTLAASPISSQEESWDDASSPSSQSDSKSTSRGSSHHYPEGGRKAQPYSESTDGSRRSTSQHYNTSDLYKPRPVITRRTKDRGGSDRAPSPQSQEDSPSSRGSTFQEKRRKERVEKKGGLPERKQGHRVDRKPAERNVASPVIVSTEHSITFTDGPGGGASLIGGTIIRRRPSASSSHPGYDPRTSHFMLATGRKRTHPDGSREFTESEKRMRKHGPNLDFHSGGGGGSNSSSDE